MGLTVGCLYSAPNPVRLKSGLKFLDFGKNVHGKNAFRKNSFKKNSRKLVFSALFRPKYELFLVRLAIIGLIAKIFTFDPIVGKVQFYNMFETEFNHISSQEKIKFVSSKDLFDTFKKACMMRFKIVTFHIFRKFNISFQCQID